MAKDAAKLISGTGIGSPADPVSQNDDQAIEITRRANVGFTPNRSTVEATSNNLPRQIRIGSSLDVAPWRLISTHEWRFHCSTIHGRHGHWADDMK
jgi:hypothetical protein